MTDRVEEGIIHLRTEALNQHVAQRYIEIKNMKVKKT